MCMCVYIYTPWKVCVCIHTHTHTHTVEGGGNSRLAQRSPVSQENTLLSAVIINIFSLMLHFLLLHFEVFFL